MMRLEEDVQVESGFVAFEFLESAGDDGAGETGLVPGEDVRSWWAGAVAGLSWCRDELPGRSALPLPITIMCAGTVMLMVAVKRLMP